MSISLRNKDNLKERENFLYYLDLPLHAHNYTKSFFWLVAKVNTLFTMIGNMSFRQKKIEVG